MPYDWHVRDDGSRHLVVWRHRSLSPAGFAWAIGAAAVALSLPMIAMVGSAVMWGLLPFAAAALAALWWAVQHGWRGGGPREDMTLERAALELTRHDPGRSPRRWRANPFWVRAALRRDGPVESYLTLTDGVREVELGAFLSADERRQLHAEIVAALGDIRAPG